MAGLLDNLRNVDNFFLGHWHRNVDNLFRLDALVAFLLDDLGPLLNLLRHLPHARLLMHTLRGIHDPINSHGNIGDSGALSSL